MELLTRYLAAVGFWLPKEQRQDILAELSEAIRSRIEEQEGALGRALTESEQEAILKDWGSPVVVAGRYVPPRHLVGPALYPVYRLVLKGAFLFYIVPWFAVWLAFFAIDSKYRLGSPGAALQGLWNTMAFGFTAITAAFAILERYHSTSKFMEAFNPRKLPPVRNTERMSRTSAVTGFVTNAVTALWWVDVLRLPEIPGISFRVAPEIARAYYWPVLAFLVAVALLDLVNIIRPVWTRQRASVSLVVHVGGVVLAGLLLAAGPFVVVAGAAPDPVLREIAKWTGLSFAVVLAFCGLDYALRGVQDLRRARGQEPLAHWAMRLFTGENCRAL